TSETARPIPKRDAGVTRVGKARSALVGERHIRASLLQSLRIRLGVPEVHRHRRTVRGAERPWVARSGREKQVRLVVRVAGIAAVADKCALKDPVAGADGGAVMACWRNLKA